MFTIIIPYTCTDYVVTANNFDDFLHVNTMIACNREGLFRNKSKDVEQQKFFNTNNKHIQYMCMYISGPVLLGYIHIYHMYVYVYNSIRTIRYVLICIRS